MRPVPRADLVSEGTLMRVLDVSHLHVMVSFAEDMPVDGGSSLWLPVDPEHADGAGSG